MLSVGLNVALAAAAAKWLRAPQPSVLSVPTQTEASAKTGVACAVTNLPPGTTFVTNRFHWRQLESTNYDEFVANLRRVGCPERTIRDLIVADVWQTFAAFKNRPDTTPFWANGPRRVAAERQREAEAFQLKEELQAMLRRLFGYEWTPELERDIFKDEQVICRVLLGEVSEDQFQRAYGLIMSAPAAKEEVEWRCRNIFLDEDYAELRRWRDEAERQLRAILPPAPFEEFCARAGLMDWLFKSGGLEELKPTATELRQITLAGVQVRPLGWNVLELEESQTKEEKDADKAALARRMREILGEARFVELELLEDCNYRGIRSFANESLLPIETAHLLYEVRKLAAEEVQNLRQDKALDPTVRTQQLEAVTASVSREVNALLGSKFGDYLQKSGQWVTNVNRL